MSRSTTLIKQEKKRPLSPWWRGVGCVMIVVIFAISFALSSWFVDRVTDRDHPLQLPAQLEVMHSGLRTLQNQFKAQFPWFGMGRYVAPAGLSLIVAMFSYGVIEAIYAFFRGNINDPRDVRDWKPTSRRSRNVRRCR